MKAMLWVLGVGVLLASCGVEEGEVVGRYDTEEEVLGMPAIEGEIIWASPCAIKLRTDRGGDVWIGSPATRDALGGFVVGRKNGERMRLPGDFVDWLERE